MANQLDFKVKNGLIVGGNADIGGAITSVDSIQLDTAVTYAAPGNGKIIWNETESALEIGLGNDVVASLPEVTFYHATNNTGSTIAKGTLVVSVGTVGNSGKILIAPYLAASHTPVQIMGVTVESIATGLDGHVAHFGKVRGIQTNGANYSETWVNGDILYARAAGGLTKTLPAAPNTKTIIAIVISAHPSNGTLFVRPSLSSNLGDDDLVQLSGLATGDLLVYNGTTGRFENSQSLNLSGPSVIDVNSTSTALRITQRGTGNALVVEDSANPDSTPFVIDADGRVGVGKVPDSPGISVYSATQARILVEGDSNTTIAIRRASDDVLAGQIGFGKRRGTIASPTTVLNGDLLGSIVFNSYTDPSFTNTTSAIIGCTVDGTPSPGSAPSTLTFNTTSIGALSTTERMRITGAGNIGIGTTAPSVQLVISKGNTTTGLGNGGMLMLENTDGGAFDQRVEILFKNVGQVTSAISSAYTSFSNPEYAGDLIFATKNFTDTAIAERVRITRLGNVGIGTTAPGSTKLVVAEGSSGTALLANFVNSTNAGGTKAAIRLTNSADVCSVQLLAHRVAANAGADFVIECSNPTPGDLVERFRVTEGGFVGIGTSSPTALLTASNGGAEGYEVSPGQAVAGVVRQIAYNRSTSAWLPFRTQALEHQFYNASGEVIRITPAGNLIRGAGSAGVTSSGGAITGIETLAGDTAGSSIGQYSFATINAAPFLEMGFSRNATIGSQTVVNNGDVVGAIRFSGSDGTNFIRVAQIVGVVDGTPGTNDMPGRLVFSTTADGASTPTERLRIDSAGNVGIGTSSPAYKLSVAAGTIGITNTAGNSSGVEMAGNGNTIGSASFFVGQSSGGLALLFQRANEDMYFATNALERMRITASGNLGLGTSSPTGLLDASSGIYAIVMGADSGVTTRTNATQKLGRFGGYHYTNAEEPVCLILSSAEATNNVVSVGGGTGVMNTATQLRFFTAATSTTLTGTERMRLDSAGNVQTLTGAQVVWAPAPASISTTATLTNANIQAQIINTTGTSYTVTMPLGTTMETLVPWATTDLGYNFTVINTASGTITMAVNTGVTSLGGLTIATGVSAQFRIRRTAANTFILYRLS